MRHCYRIGEVAIWCGVTTATVRWWCKEFAPWVRPTNSPHGQRVFTRDKVLMLGVIRELLYTELYTVEGAKRQLRQAKERLAAADEERRAG